MQLKSRPCQCGLFVWNWNTAAPK